MRALRSLVGSVLVLASLSLTQAPARAAAPPQPNPAICKRPGGYYQIHDGVGASFYQCDNAYRPYKHTCSDGLLFNEEARPGPVCDWPDNVYVHEAATFKVSDKTGAGPAGETPDAVVRTAAASPRSLELGGLITYTAGLDAPDLKTEGTVVFTFPPTLTWVGGQDCFLVAASTVDCMAYPAGDGFEASEFTLDADLLALGPQTVTAHLGYLDQSDTAPTPDQSLTCTVLTGLIVSC